MEYWDTAQYITEATDGLRTGTQVTYGIGKKKSVIEKCVGKIKIELKLFEK